MARHIKPLVANRYGLDMRNRFNFTQYNFAKWFPGHMAKGYDTINRRLHEVDCFIEVHDARIPISGRNHNFVNTLAQARPHILILNKVDLINKKQTNFILKYYKDMGVKNIFFTNCKDHTDKSIKRIVPQISSIIGNSERYNRSNTNESLVLVIGIPNVGKSSLINALRNWNLKLAKGTRVAPVPGTTLSVLERIKVQIDPPIYVLDTPGILSPKMDSTEVSLKLALVNVIKNNLIGEEIIADYLLYRMNYQGNHAYVEFCGLEKPTDDINELLTSICDCNNFYNKISKMERWGENSMVPDKKRAANIFINNYRKNLFGSVLIEEIPLS